MFLLQCDENRPTCSNCANRDTVCEYESLTSLLWTSEQRASRHVTRASRSNRDQRTETILGVGANTQGIVRQILSESSAPTSSAPTLNLQHMELMMQWCNSTYQTLSRNERTDTVWRHAVPEEALSNPFLMHGILALSALHLARTSPEKTRRAAYLEQAMAHQNQALELFRDLLCDLNKANSKPMVAFAGIVVLYTFGSPHIRDVQDPWACIDSLCQVLVLSRGVLQLIRYPADTISGSAFAPILQLDESYAPLQGEAKTIIDDLYEANNLCGLQDANHETEVYASTIGNFAKMLSLVHGGVTTSTVAIRWAIKLPQRFLEIVRGREPLSLVILSYYCVLLQYLKHRWCFEDWCVQLVQAVWAILDDHWRSLVHWPMREILGENYLDQV